MRKKILNLALKVSGKDIFKEFYKIKDLEYKPIENNLILQKKKLYNILRFSWKYVPFYRDVLLEAGVAKNSEIYIDNFHRIKPLKKIHLRNNIKLLSSADNWNKKRKPFFQTSGGSTGEPAIFIQDKEFWIKLMATKWLFYSFITQFPCKFLLLWGDKREIQYGNKSFNALIKNWVYNRKFLNTFRMDEGDINKYITIINKFKPEIIEAYVQSIFEISNYIKRKNIKIFSPKGVLTSAGTLYPAMHTLIEEQFRCRVFNRYGSREVGDIACSCEKNEGLHISILNNYVEILDKNMNPCKSGEMGKIYITSLDNFSMPLIRYDIGDMAVASNKVCSCRRGMPLLDRVVGREVGVFKTSDGSFVDGLYFTFLFYFKEWVKKYQAVQKEYNYIEILCVLNGEKNIKDINSINSGIKKVMGEKCRIVWKFVSEIPSLKSGKYLYTRSEVK